MAKSLKKRLEEEGKWQEIQKTMTITPRNNSISNVKQTTTNNSTWDRVLNKTNDLMNSNNMRSNLTMKNINSNPMIQYIGLNKGEEQNKKYQEEIKKQVQEKELLNAKKLAESRNKRVKEGNIVQKVGTGLETILTGLGEGGASAVGNTVGTMYSIVEGLAEKVGIKTKNKKDIGKNFSPMDSKEYVNMIKRQEDVSREYGSELKHGLGTVNTVSNVIGNMLVSAGMGGDKASRVASAVTSASQGYIQTLNEEQTNKRHAFVTGGLKGLITYELEGLTGGNFMGKGSLDDFATKAISKMSKKEITKKAMSKLYEVFGENIEENAENALGHIVDVALGNEEVPTIDQLIKETLETTKDTTLTTAILSLFGLGGNTYNDVKLYEMKQDQIKNSGLDEKTQQRLDNVSQKYDLSPEDLQKLIDNTKNGFYEENQPTTIENKPISEQTQQVISNEGKVAENGISQEIKKEVSTSSTSNKGRSSRMTTSNNSITSSEGNVNNKQTDSFNLQKLDERLSGDDLLDAQDFIEEVKSVGAEVDENGYVTVYHQTTSENAKKIKESGKMSAKEDGIFFSTSQKAQQSEGRGNEKLQFKIPAEMLQLDDIFDDNADVKIPLKNKNEVIDVSQYIVKENDYRGSHQIENAKRVTELDISDIESRVKKVNGYLTKQDYTDLNKLKKILNAPNEKVKIYRASPVHELNSGDWVTTDKMYAKNVSKENGGKVYEYEIDASELYYPDNVKDLPSLHRLSSFQYVGDTRYLKENTEWQEYLEKNFKTEGTRTYGSQVKNGLPQESVLRQNVTNEIGLPKETDMPESIEVKLSKLKKESEDLKQRRNTIENMDIFEMSSEDWLKQTEELNKITDRETVLNSKIEELENIPDTLNNIVRNRKENKTLKEKVSESNAKFQKAFVNQYYEIDKLANKTNNKNLSIALDNWIGAKQQVQTTIDGNTKFGTGQTNNEGKVIGESVTQILKDVYKKKDIINLTDYMQNRLNIERSKHKKSNLDVTPEQSQAIVERYEKQKPYLKEVADKLYKLYDNVLQNCVDAGLGTSELKNAVREMYPSYMPIYKNISELTNFIDSGEINNKMIKKAVGGQTDILAIDVATAEYVMGMNRKIQLNNLLVELKNSLEKNNQLEDYVNTEQPSDLEDFASDKQKKANEMIMQTADGENIATCYIDGMAHQFKISDEIYNLLKPQDIKQTKFGEELISSANNLFRKMVTTYNPFFTLRNMVKDFQNGCYNTKYGAPTYVKNYFKGIKEIILNGELSKTYRNAGLQGNTKYSKSKGILSSKSANFIQKYNPISLTNNIIDFINTNIETMGRMSEFISAIESGKDLNEARYEASEVTLNFKRGGETSKAITKWGGTFFNSSILAVEKTIKNVTGKNGKKGLANFIVMGLVSGVGLSMLNHLVYKDDDDYEELPDYIKDGYWLIKKNDGSGTFYRIAKDQITTAIGSSARRIYQMAKGEEDIGELEDMFKAIFENIGVENPITSNLYAPIVQAISGKTWYDGDLISEYQETLSPELQYDYRTNEISKWTANQIAKLPEGVKSTLKGLPVAKQAYDIASSPKKSDYVMQQYLGGVGKLLLPTVTPYAEQSYIEKEMQTNSVLKSKYPSMVYDEFDKAEIEYNSYGTNQDKYLYLTEAKKQLSDFYTQIRETENDTTLTNEEKRDKEYQIRKELNRTAKDIINNLEKATSKTNSSSIGDKEYYKDTEGKYKKISDEDKIEGISTETYATYRNKLTKATEQKRQEKGNDKAELNDTEMIEIIKNSNYTDKEKDALFDDQINDKTYKNLKLLNKNNISKINQYMDYKTADLDSDKKDDGTKKGKTIYGSKEKKITTYLKNSSFNEIERIYLYGQTYKLSNEQRKALEKHIKQLKLTSEEQKQIYLDLASSNVEELKDGRIRWK